MGDCQALASSGAWLAAFAVPLNYLLFFFRIRAVFNDSKLVVYLFAFLWVATLGSSLAMPFGVEATHIGTTRTCLDTLIADFVSAAPIASGINDTLVFIAISAKLMSYSWVENTWRAQFKSFFSSREKGVISSVLLQTGQLYYLCVLFHNVRNVITHLIYGTIEPRLA